VSTKECILHAAVISQTGMIFLGKSHSCCMRQCVNVDLTPMGMAKAQGFFTNKGRFVDRETAAVIAFKAKQTTKKKDILFSEDLWSPQEKGLFKYDSIEGYTRKEIP